MDGGTVDGMAVDGMTPSELEHRAAALFGSRWQTELARHCGVDARTVRRWKAGDREIPPMLNALLHAWERLAAMGVAVDDAEG